MKLQVLVNNKWMDADRKIAICETVYENLLRGIIKGSHNFGTAYSVRSHQFRMAE